MKTNDFFEMRKGFKKRLFSLKGKWTIGATLAIFLTYSLFTVAIYQGFSRMMISQEHNKLEDALLSISDSLMKNPNYLIKGRLHQTLRSDAYRVGLGNDPDIAENFLYAQVFEKGVSVSIYDTKQTLLYESVSTSINFEPNRELLIRAEAINGKSGLVGVAPISNEEGEIIYYIQVSNQLIEYHALKGRILTILLSLGVMALVVSGLLGYLLASNFLKPIRTMALTMNDIRQNMQSTSRIPLSESNDELSHLTTIFNEMLDNIQQYMEQQQRFIEDASHELRTPVAIMEGHLQLLNRWGKEDPEILSESLEASLQEVERMKNLVQEMLDLSRAEQVDIFYPDKLTHVKEVVNQTYMNFQMIYPDFTFNLDNELPKNLAVKMYRNHLEQILIILLDNAVKYSTNRKEILISAGQDGHTVRIAIQDFGEGISEDNLQHIFNRFFRVDTARSRQKGGNGLGLSIAKQLLDGYHGEISADSIPGQGTTFRITLPIYHGIS